MAQTQTLRHRLREVLAPVPGAVAGVRLVVETVRVAQRHRAGGLAAEAAFFTLLSLPPLLLGVVAGAGFATDLLGPQTMLRISDALEAWSLRFLTPQTVQEVIMPTFEETLGAGRADILSLSFLVSVWWGSRALRVFLETVAIMYGQGGLRRPARSYLLSLTAYLASLLMMGLTLPLLLVGPGYVHRWLPDRLADLAGVYWPLVGLLAIVGLGALYHLATPDRSPFTRDLPGAVLAVLLWVVSSALLRVWADEAAGGSSVFGPLTAPIILMIWLYFVALAVLVGAALNAALRRLWPPPEYRGPRVRATDWWEERRGSRAAGRPARRASDTGGSPDLDTVESVG